MNKRNLIIASLTTATLLMTATPVYAENFGLQRLINHETRVQNEASETAQRQENNITNSKQRADKAIENRITELNRLASRIQNDSRLSADEKSSLSTEVQTDITNLTNLKTKIDADTDLTTLRTDVKSIETYKIYAVIVPQTQLLITIDNISTLTTRLQGLTPKLQDLINNLKSQGKDVSSIQPLLDDINNQLSTINSKLAADKSTVMAVTPQSTNPNATFVSVRQDLAVIRQDFAQIRHDIGQMRQAFQGLNTNPTSSPTPSPTPTTSPTP